MNSQKVSSVNPINTTDKLAAESGNARTNDRAAGRVHFGFKFLQKAFLVRDARHRVADILTRVK